MKIVIAPDHYKESLSALAVALQIEAGFRQILPDAEYVTIPMTDGGEGTVEAMVAATGGRLIQARVSGPLGHPVDAYYGLTGASHYGMAETAVIEMSAASGLMLLTRAERNPLRTTSYGTGELIRAALDSGARRFLIGLAGSASNDGGAGMARALGASFLDAQDRQVALGGGALRTLAHIDVENLDPRLRVCRIDVACDVDNTLTGPQGASAVYGPQNGATVEMVAQLDHNLGVYAERIRLDLGLSVADVPGAGAAGGLGAGLLAFLNARLRPGIDIVTEALGLEAIIADADLVITGEGRIDGQTAHGKTPIGVARLAKRYGKPVIGIAGCLTEQADAVYPLGIDAIFSVLSRPCTPQEALAEAAANVRRASRNVAAALMLGEHMIRARPPPRMRGVPS